MNEKNIIMLVILSSVVFMYLWTVPVFASESLVENRINTEFQTRAANIGWRYKNEDGRLYRCQYDYTNQKWIGEWELCP